MIKILTASFSARLITALVALLLILGFAFMALNNWSNNRYYQEITQNLNKSLAMYIAQREPLIVNGVVNEKAMQELSTLVMIVNPIVEVYLLDASGDVVSYSVPHETVVKKRISLKPIQDYLAGSARFPITGESPSSLDNERVFSVFPVKDQQDTNGVVKESEENAGYLYVVLGGQAYQTLTQSLHSSYILQQSLAGLGIIMLFAAVFTIIIFLVLTNPLRKLAREMNEFHVNELKASAIEKNYCDEITRLSLTFSAMKQKIHDQIESLQETDRLRRELISNVSHDLRTPMSSMQGYLEMLLKPAITADERKHYIEVAFKHCRRLTQLVKELFELSKLDAGRVNPEFEEFSLAELMQDVAQKFSLSAKQKEITIVTPQNSQLFLVKADIGLIERVLENLIDNALRYTPKGGIIRLLLAQQQGKVEVGIEDTGIGLTQEDLPHIFERYYRAQKPTEYQQQSTGLGLAIVKRILELHDSVITVESQPNQGTCFKFPLTISRQHAA